jgi:uncharacterized membrane protein
MLQYSLFALLFVMPLHPMAILAAFGGELSIALIWTGGNKRWVNYIAHQ